MLLVKKCRLLSTRYQGRETKNNISLKLNYLSPRATSTENKGKKENMSFLRDSGQKEKIKRIKRKRDDNYDVKNGTQRMRQDNGFNENQNHENKYSNKDVRINKRTYHDDDDDDDDEGEDDDENEYLNQLKQKHTHTGRNNNSQNNIRNPEINKNKNKNWEESDGDDDFNNDGGRTNNNHHRMQFKTVGGRDSSKQYENLNQKGNVSVNSRGDDDRVHRERYQQNSSSSSNSSVRREDRDEGVQGSGQGQEQGQGQGERDEEGEGEEDSMESVMVWAMALVGKRERESVPHSNIHHHTTD